MKKALLVLSVSALITAQPVFAEKWSAIGLLTTQVKNQQAKVEFVEIDDFESRDACMTMVMSEAMSNEYIGQGGTNGKIPPVQWNYDADCVLKRND
ncbi:hypothetical protein W03_09630 [Nitrosomonas sp. PY1]|uniref:hypothetical protein n=1 Tax=Nitrosomonas sp. PY1 TaxID=1803906 RepID=UPI001FC8C03F|nr:hypothetical protein [Nitrosomonas sp. PY1]GKS68959.1 hypothetical protein W03_09630 [Nitrosomonas sp. PY1]